MKRKVIKTGNSLAVTIPHDFVKEVGIKIGDEVEFKVNARKSRLVLLFIKKAKQIALFK
ncbi:MAG: AbrB/MazE/SpoVT family DNA-binding domain-containing protein [Candidatus Shapirobacteria bacterium]